MYTMFVRAVLIISVCILSCQVSARTVRCGRETIDADEQVCCNGFPHNKAWLNDTACCNQYAYNPTLETCCNGMVDPGYGLGNEAGQCCGDESYDDRCYECIKKKKIVVPKFDFRHQVCCDGRVRERLPNSTCCCGDKVFDPTNLYCCDGEIKDRPDDVPGDCCNCGLTLVDIVIVLDSSESIVEDREAHNWDKMLNFVMEILRHADIDNDNVRVGVETFRHDATDEFHLDTYHDKAHMFDHISRIRYRPGSTNTALALEFARTIMFDQRRGDRANVENVLIVVTDGQSDNFTQTVEQARLTREAGVHIFAIGVGLTNNAELLSIASPPAEKNKLEINNFDHLAELKGKIFAAICTGTPDPTIYKKCGNDWYLPGTELCCNGNPQMVVAGDDTACCGQRSYDTRKEICCAGVFNERKAGKRTVCCGRFAQHPEQELCCDARPVPRPNSNYSECCDIYAFNPDTEVCCEGYVSKGFGDIITDTGCCDDYSYDKRCYECQRGRLMALFDTECQICCDGVVHNMTIGLSCCCGSNIFRPAEFICCDNKLRKRLPSESDLCCECGNALVDIGIVLDSSESIRSSNWEILKRFLIDLIKGSDINTGATRFGLITYRHDVKLEFHLHDFLREANMVNYLRRLDYDPGSTKTGLALEVMRDSLFVPRNGDRIGVPNVAIVITDGLSDDPAHTLEQARLAKENGIFIYVVAVGLNKTQELNAIASPPSKDNIFTSDSFEELKKLESTLFKVISDNCPQEPKEKLKKPCGTKMYDPRFEVCCIDKPQPIYDTVKNTKCCGRKSFNFKIEMCCEETVSRRPHPTRSVCCQNEGYDPIDAICCYNTTVIPRQGLGAVECCGLETYDPKKELCCDDMLFDNYGPNGCCGACCLLKEDNTLVSYDTRCYDCVDGELVPLYDCAYQRCCDGVTQNITSENTCCCGKTAFDPSELICCDGKLKERKLEDEQECCECVKNLIDICILMDSSESVGRDNWRLTEEFLEDLIAESSLPQVRFALVTYRHIVDIRFKLNKFSNMNALLKEVDSLPYVPGSTNTGLALETMRKEVFKRKAGDRPSAPNFAILITDGRSDNQEFTIQQAELAKRQGIHIVALGIGLRDQDELNAVASSPASENAIPIANFTMLKAIKARIFNELSNTVCSQYPETRCKVPCGDYFIDEKLEYCCYNKKPGPRVAGNMTECCDLVTYDPDCFICCEGGLVSKYAGEFTKCCCRFGYDSRVQICCGNQILPKVGPGDVTKCCHNRSYDSRTEVCCNLTNIQPSYGKDRTGCCGDTSYDILCDECTKNTKIVPKYDIKTQLCCEGEIQDKQFEDRSCCCGKEQFDVDVGICCDGKLNKRPKKGEVVCCGKAAYDPKTNICCDEKVNPRMNGYETLCCGKTSYHPDDMFCCDGNLNNRTTKDDNCCCDERVFDVNKDICCEGSVYPLVKPGMRKSTTCCANKAFDPNTHICCKRKLQNLTEGNSTACCGKKAYNVDIQVCENGKVKQVSDQCQGKPYDSNKEVCCNGWINNKIKGATNFTRCCFDQAYDVRKNVCCCNGFLQPAFAGRNTQCCYSFGYDAASHICCDGQVVEKTVPSADCCCERQSYNSEMEICCGGKVRSRCVGLFTKCCGTEAYDPGYKICCGGKLYNRTYGHDTYCCGDEIYTPLLAACCGDKIAYRRKLKLEW